MQPLSVPLNTPPKPRIQAANLRLPSFITAKEFSDAAPDLQCIISQHLKSSKELIAGAYYRCMGHKIPRRIAMCHPSHLCRTDEIVGFYLTIEGACFHTKYQFGDPQVKLSHEEYEQIGRIWFEIPTRYRKNLINYNNAFLVDRDYKTPAFLLEALSTNNVIPFF